jgi:hypothetical protein
VKTTMMVVAAGCMLSGCIGMTPKYTPEEQAAITTRRYEGVSSQQVYSAATLIFEAADKKNFKISHHDNELDAKRTRILFPIWLHFNWTVVADESNGGTLVRVTSTSLLGSKEVPNTTGKAIYELFFGRLQYVLGKSDKWPTCADADERIRSEKGRGTAEALCLQSDETIPGRLIAKATALK